MNQSFIDAIMHFVSLVFLPFPGRKYDSISLKIREYVEKAGIEINADECLTIYNSYSDKYRAQFDLNSQETDELTENVHRQILADAGRSAQQNLFLRERFLIILALLEFYELYFRGNDFISVEIERLSENLNLKKSDFTEASDFISNKPDDFNRNLIILEEDKHLDDRLEGTWVEEYNQETKQQENRDIFQRIRGKLVFRYFSNFNLLAFRYEGKDNLYVNNKTVYPGFFYSLDKNDTICFEDLLPIQTEEILKHFKLSGNSLRIELKARSLAFFYSDSENTVKPFSVTEESGKLIGIIGNNGVGKSTILKLIAGHLKPSGGNIYINDTDLIKKNFRIQSVIGFVSNDDMVFPDLSIYENLLFQARLSLGNLSPLQISERIEDVIRKFGMQEFRDIKAKNLNSRIFSMYMRKCINVAIEMLRNPLILCIDEPLTGLSYTDAKRLMNLLKEEAYSGRLVVMTVHLPTLEIYKLFDKIWLIDYDGYLIYSGEPKDIYSYLNNTGLIPFHLRNKEREDVSPEEIINLIETRKIDPDGRISNERLIKPETWYNEFRKNWEADSKNSQKTPKVAPVSVSGIPGIEQQFFIYLLRNCRILINDWRGIIIYLLGIPAVGIILAIMLRHVSGEPYTLRNNIFLPLYIFFIVNYMMFSGLLTAADSIFRERNNLFRDYQINLSLFSYLNSKVIFVFLLSIVQIFIIVFAGNAILGIKGMALQYILPLFAVSAFANLLALNLSSAVRSISSLYLVIPFILIPCMIYSGFLIRFDDYYKYRSDDKNIPLVAEFVPSRWAYESMIVSQFKDNSYNRYFFTQEFIGYQNAFNSEKLIPMLELSLETSHRLIGKPDSVEIQRHHFKLLKNEFGFLSEREEVAPFEGLSALNENDFDEEIYENTKGYLTSLKFQIENSNNEIISEWKLIKQAIIDSLKTQRIEDFISQHHNVAIENLVYGRFQDGYARIDNEHVLKSGSSVFLYPEMNTGIAGFFSTFKRFSGRYIETFRFNLSVLWLLNLTLYIILLGDFFRKFFNLFRKHKLEKN